MSLIQAQMYILQLRKKDIPQYAIWTPGWESWARLKDFIESDQSFFAFRQPQLGTSEKTQSKFDSRNQTSPKIKLKSPKGKNEVTNTDYVVSPGPYTIVTLDDSDPRVDYGYFYEHFSGDDLTLSGQDKGIKKIRLSKKDQEKKRRPIEDIMERRKDERHDFKIEVFLVNPKSTFHSFSENISLSGTRLEDEIPRSFLNEPFDLLIINKLDPNPKTARLLFKARIVGDLADPRRLNFQSAEPDMIERLKALLNAYISYYHTQKKASG